MSGSYLPFSRDEVLRRYGTKDRYLGLVRAEARKLVRGRYLLERDVAAMVAQSGKEWDFVMGK